jgi:hypothetical protein
MTQEETGGQGGFSVDDDDDQFEWCFALSTVGGEDGDGDGTLTYMHGPGAGIKNGEWQHIAATYDGSTMCALHR